MENITLGQIATAVAFLVALITGVSFLHKKLKEWLSALLNEKFNAIDLRLDTMAERIENVDMNNCKNFLVQVLADIENGLNVDQVELSRFWEQYDFYTSHGGNSYIRERVNSLKEKGLL